MTSHDEHAEPNKPRPVGDGRALPLLRLHIGRDQVYYLIRTTQLRSLKIGKLCRITDARLHDHP